MPIPGDLLNQLAAALAQPYSDHASARTRATTAGLRVQYIPYDARPFDYWVAILQAAEEQGALPRLLDQAAAEYPVEPDLRTARAAYDRWVAAGRPLPPLAVVPPRVYVSHATAGTADAPLLQTVIEALAGRGVTVWVDADNVLPAEPWSSKLLRELGSCDGAVVLLNSRVLDDPGNWVHDELRLLRWRSWLEADSGFRLVVLCLDEACQARLQGEPWDLLEVCHAPLLHGVSDAGRRALLDQQLQPFDGLRRRDWRMDDLQAALAQVLRTLPASPVRLQQAAQDLAQQARLSLPVPQTEGVDWLAWWSRALLWGGPGLLRALVDNLGVLVSRDARMGLRELIAPAWVDLRAAGLIPRLSLHPNVQDRAFYVNSTAREIDPRFIAEMYLRRACWREGGARCWPIAVVPPRATTPEALRVVRQQLEAALNVAPAANDWFEPAPAADEAESWDAVRAQVEANAQTHQPTILLLPGSKLADRSLLGELRDRLGPVAFFFLSAQPEVANQVGVAPLQPAISAGADRQAYDDWRALGGALAA